MIVWALRIENRDRLTHFQIIKNMAIFGKYLYVDYEDEIIIRIRIFAHMRIIRMNRIFLQPHGHPYSEPPQSVPRL